MVVVTLAASASKWRVKRLDIGGEKRRMESLNVERATGLGGDFIDVEEEEYEDEDKEQHLMTMKKRGERERGGEEERARFVGGEREGNVGNDNDDRNNDRNNNDNSSGEDPLWSPRGTAQG